MEIKKILDTGVAATKASTRGRGRKRAGAGKDAVTVALIDRTLVVGGPSKMLDEIAELIEQLDVPGAESHETRVYTVPPGHKLDDFVGLLKELVTGHQTARKGKMGRSPGAGSGDTRIVSQTAARRVIISAPSEEFEEIEEHIALLLEAEPAKKTVVKFITIKHSDPSSIAAIVEPMLQRRLKELIATGEIVSEAPTGKRQKPVQQAAVSAVADVSNARLILTIPAELLAEAEALIAELDQPQKRRLFTLEHANPEEMKQLIQSGVLGAGARPRPRGKSASGQTEGVTVAVIDQTLVVNGPPRLIDEIAELIGRFDVPGADESVTRVYDIPPGYDLLQIIKMLDTLTTEGGDARRKRASKQAARGTSQTRFLSDSSGRRLIVSAPPDKFENIEANLALLLEGAPRDQLQIKFIDVKHISPAAVAEIVKPILQSRLAELTGTAIGLDVADIKRGRTAKRPGIEVTPDANNERVIVTAPAALMAEAESLIARIDQEQDRRTFTLEHADPVEIQSIIESGVLGPGKRRAGKGAAASPDVVVAVIDRTLMVSGPSEQLNDIAAMIERFDVPAAETNEMRVYSVPPGRDINDIVTSLDLLIDGSAKAPLLRGKLGKLPKSLDVAGEVRVVPQASTRRILISAPPARFDEIEQTLALILEGAAPQRSLTKFIPLEHADPATVAELIEPILQMRLDELVSTGDVVDPKARAAKRSGVSVTPDVNNERIVVTAPADIVAEAEALVAKLDRPQTRDDRIMRTIKLVRASPVEMVETINAMLTGKRLSPKPKRPKLRDRSGVARSGTSAASGGTDKVTIVEAPGGGAVVLSGVPDAVDEVESWILRLDQEATTEQTLKIYHIRTADVEQLADTIMDLCDTALPKARVTAKSLDLGLDFEPPSRVRRGAEITLTTDYWNRTILVRASPMKLFEVDRVVEIYDGKGGADPVIPLRETQPYLIYELENVDAFDATIALESVLDVVWTHGEPPEVDYISGTNILVVKCMPEHNAEIISLLKTYVDKESEGEKPTIAIVYEPVEGAIASDVAKLLKMRMPGLNINLQQLGEDLPAIEQLGAYRPCVLPLSLLEALQAASTVPLAQAIDDDDDDRREAARRMAGSFAAQDASDDGTGGTVESTGPDTSAAEAVGPVNLRYDDRQGVIVIEGSPREVEEVRDMLEEVLEELETLGGKPDIRVFRIKYRNVQVAASILETMFNAAKTPQQQRVAQQQQRLRLMQQRMKQQQQKQRGQQPGQAGQQQPPATPPAEQEDDKKKKKGTGEIRVYPDAQTRSLIIRAATEDFPIVVELLATIDRPADVVAEFRVFQLDQLAASDVEEQLKVLLGISQQRRPIARRRTGRQQGRGGAAGQAIQQIEDALLNIGLGDAGAGAIDAASDIKITSNPTANTLLVMAPKSALKLIEEFIQKLEAQEVPTIVQRTYKLEHANAAEVATQLKEAFGGSRGGRRAQQGFDPNTVSQAAFTAAPRTNTLIVSAYERDFERIETLIKELDQKLDSGETVQTYVLKNADAGQAAKTLNDVYGTGRQQRRGDGAKTVKFVGDASSNTLFVTAPPDLREGIAQHIKELDVLAGELAKPKVIRLTEGKASEVARFLQSAFESRGAKRGGGVRVIGDDLSNQLIVTAPQELFNQIESLAKTMDQSAVNIETRIFRLKHARAVDVHQQLMDMVRQLAQQLRGSKSMDVFTAVADDRSNTIVCVGGPVAFSLVEQVIAEIDVPKDKSSGGRARRILSLKYADATELAGLITEDLRSTQGGGRGKGGQNVSVIANQALNSLLIGGPADEVEEVLALALAMDQLPSGESDEVEVFALQYSDAEAMKEVLEAYLAKPGGKGRRKGGGQLRGDVRINANPQNNTIVVSGSREQIDRLSAVIAKLDVEVEDAANAPRIVKLDHVRASQIEPILNQMFVETQAGRKRGSSGTMPPVIVADDASDTLIIRAGAGDFTQIAQLIELLDIEGAGDEATFTVVAVAEGVKVSQLAEMVETTINEGERIKAQRWGIEPGTLVVSADARTNSLILAGSVGLFADAERLVRQMERMGPTGGMAIRTIKTKNIAPEEVRRLLQQVISENQGDKSRTARPKGRSVRPKGRTGSKRRPPARRGSSKRGSSKRGR
ncbi:MAG: secretin N-terminal domain-containing protein [Phycisphaerae bacterium]